MLNFNSSTEIYLSCGSTDLRKFIDGLAVIVQIRFKLYAFSNSLFIFYNKNRDT